MASLSAMFKDNGTGPYPLQLKVVVVAVKSPVQYRGKDGSQREVLSAAVSDGLTVCQTVCYESKNFPKFKVGTSLMLRNTIRRSEQGVKTIVITNNTRVYISTPLELEVPESHKKEGENILNPPPAETLPISQALSSPVKKRVSISGKIVQEDEPRTVSVRGEDVNIKTVMVEDNSGKAKVTLWREAASAEVRPGDQVSITDVIVNSYQNQTSLSTTSKSKVEKCETPITTSNVVCEAIDVRGDETELLLETEETITVSTETMQQALIAYGSDIEVEMATASGPLHLELVHGTDVVSITVTECSTL